MESARGEEVHSSPHPFHPSNVVYNYRSPKVRKARGDSSMPIHDWTRVGAGIFHHFHQRWLAAISDALNSGLLPPEYYALAENRLPGIWKCTLLLRLGWTSTS
jgi:hypothetical protein